MSVSSSSRFHAYFVLSPAKCSYFLSNTWCFSIIKSLAIMQETMQICHIVYIQLDKLVCLFVLVCVLPQP